MIDELAFLGVALDVVPGEPLQVAGHVHRAVRVQRPAEHAHDTDAADVRVAGGAHDLGDRHQTMGTIGLYYTWLSDTRLGTVEWRDAPQSR